MLPKFFLLVASASLAFSKPLTLVPRVDATNIKCTDANAYVLSSLYHCLRFRSIHGKFSSFRPQIIT